MPKGIRVLMVYTIIVALFYLMTAFVSDLNLFFGLLLEDTAARLSHILFFLASVTIVYGIAYRKAWCYAFAITIYALSIINSTASLIMLAFTENYMISSLSGVIVPFYILSTLMNLVTLWYVHEKRLYFHDPLHKHRHTVLDKVFIHTIHLFYLTVIIFTMIVTVMFFLDISKHLAPAMVQTSRMSLTDAQGFCEEKQTEQAKDLCFIATVYNNLQAEDVEKLCRSIDSGYYRFTCYRVVWG